MSHGPPTPPPTGAAELMDHEKDAAAPVPDATTAAAAAPAASGTTATIDPYHRALPAIADLVSQHNYSEVIRVAELAELNNEGDDRSTRLLVTAPLVLAYLIQDELAPARFVLTRLPQALTSQPLSQALFSLLTSVWERVYEKIYANAEKVFNVVRSLSSQDLVTVLLAMTTTFTETFRKRTLVLINRAYTSISLPIAQLYFGLGTEETIKTLTATGWNYDGSSKIVFAPSLSQKGSAKVLQGPSSLANFDFVAAATAKLEA